MSKYSSFVSIKHSALLKKLHKYEMFHYLDESDHHDSWEKINFYNKRNTCAIYINVKCIFVCITNNLFVRKSL